MTRPALRAAGALLLLSTLPALAATQSTPVVPGNVMVQAPPAPAAVAPPVPRSPAAVALGTAFQEITAGRAAGSYVQWIATLPGFRFSPATSALLVKQFGTSRLFDVTRKNLAGGARAYVFAAPALRRANPDGSRFAWDAMTGQARVEPDGVTVVNQFNAPRVALEDKTMRIALRALSASGTSRDSDLAYGEGTAELANLQVANKNDGTTIAMDGLFAKYSVTDQGAGVGMRYETGMRTLSVQNERLDDLHMALQLTGLDKAALEQLGKLGKEFRARQDRLPAAKPDPARVQPLLRQLGLAAIANGAAITFDDISFSYRGSKARMHGALHFDDATPSDLDQPAALLKKVTGHAEVQIPLAMLRAFADGIARKQLSKQQPGADAATIATAGQAVYDNGLRSAVASGYVRVEGDMLVTRIDIRAGTVLINGKPFQMPKPTPPVAAVNSGAGMMRARRIADKCVLPDYPADVVAADRALSLALQLTVGADGKVGKLALARSSGMPAYDQAVLGAAATCTYIPALRNGQPVAVSEVWDIVRVPGTVRP